MKQAQDIEFSHKILPRVFSLVCSPSATKYIQKRSQAGNANLNIRSESSARIGVQQSKIKAYIYIYNNHKTYGTWNGKLMWTD